MHEMSLARSIIEIVQDEIGKAAPPGSMVKCVHFQAGRLHSIVPDSLEFHYDVLKIEDPRIEKSRLAVTLVDEKARCRVCGLEFAIDAPIFLCPSCAGAADVIDGQEMSIESIEFF